MTIKTAFTSTLSLFTLLISTFVSAGTSQIFSDDVIQDEIYENNWHYYQIELETPTKLTVKLRKLSDNVDLYVARAKKPTEDDFLCAPQKPGNLIETCRLTISTAGTWYIGIHGKSDSDYQLGVQARDIEGLTQINF